MATYPETISEVDKKKRNLVEMNWDPITRIVGSLGIFTKIDFANREVAECHSTSSIFRGYSIFMKGKDPRDSHFITSRICGICGDNHATCATYAQNMAFGNSAFAEVDLGEDAEAAHDPGDRIPVHLHQIAGTSCLFFVCRRNGGHRGSFWLVGSGLIASGEFRAGMPPLWFLVDGAVCHRA